MSIERQNELFGEFVRKKGGFEKIAEKMTEKRKSLYATVPVENIVFAVIIAIMVIVTAFALGVERGKRLARVETQEVSKTSENEIELSQIEVAPIEVRRNITRAGRNLSINKNGAGESSVPVKLANAKSPVSAAKPDKTLYTIQLISYKRKRLALREKNRLAKKKMDAFLIKANGWYQVCTGNYKDIKQAKIALEGFKGAYSGCFIRNSAGDGKILGST
ncbi:MAG: SPOR domain-containing protein [Omnitrophica bacterium]|nr:SPOR domain-containing protein [Candidatus Omnitrophota bacterium]